MSAIRGYKKGPSQDEIDTRKFVCPTCTALPNDPCMNCSGVELVYSHSPRVKAKLAFDAQFPNRYSYRTGIK